MRRAIVAALLLQMPAVALTQAVAPATEAPLFDPVTGYRLVHYRGVIHTPPEGVVRIDAGAARALWRKRALFLDVNPAPGAVRDARSGRWLLAEPHDSIPGAYWFAESGRGDMAEAMTATFLRGVRRLAKVKSHRPIVVFCQADCWMSWNAALRLHRAGLRDVRWFADGLDGWKEAGFPTARAMPQ